MIIVYYTKTVLLLGVEKKVHFPVIGLMWVSVVNEQTLRAAFLFKNISSF